MTLEEENIKLREALIMQHNVIINILTDSQLDTRTKCGQTIRQYVCVVEELLDGSKSTAIATDD